METINRTLKVIMLLLMLVGFAPSASVTLTATKAAVTANQAATDDEVEAMKEDLRRILEEFMRMSSEAYGELHENATEDEAPELYQDFEELQRLLMDMYERVYYATTMEELNALERMFRDYVVERFDAFYSQIISLYEFSAATVEGIVLKYRIIEKEKTAKVKGIGDHDANCTVTIPETVNGYTVNEIADYAFQYARIGTVVMPETIKTIGEFSFYGCSRLLSLSIPNSVTTIIRYAFAGCTSLASVTIPKFVTSIGECAFEECPGLTSISVEPGNTTYDSRNNCNAIIETASNTLITGCKNTIIPNTVTSIGAYSFMRNSLTSITIPSSVTKIGFYAFYQCWSLTSVTVKMKTPVEVEGGVSTFFNSNNATLYVPKGCKAAYESADIWKDFKTIEELPEPEIAVSFDVNGDGEVNSADITCLVNRITGITSCPNDHHPHLIDLGLPSGTKWACCNLDDTTPEGYGGYYRWGETSPLALGEMPIDYPYNSLDLNISGTQYDAATASWGAPWQMPTKEQIQELLDNSTNTWAVQDGVNGRKFTGTNGGTLFLPAAGSVWNGGLGGVGSNGSYWSSTPPTIKGYALSLEIDSDGVKWLATGRLAGLSVRPVQIANSPEESQSSPYDVNKDGKVNIADVTFLIDRIAYLERLKTLESGSADEVRTVLEEMSGTRQTNASELAFVVKENPNVEDAYTEDGDNLVVKNKDSEAVVVYPMYKMMAPFSDLQVPEELNQSRMARMPRKAAKQYPKVAIFNFFEDMAQYKVQNLITRSVEKYFLTNGYDVDYYTPNNNKDEYKFTYDNLGSVLYQSKNYAAIIIMTHGAQVNGSSYLCTGEVAGRNDRNMYNWADDKYYKIYPADIQAESNCILYLGICDGLKNDGFNSMSPVIGYSGPTCMAQANAAMLFYLMLEEGYSLEDALSVLPSEPSPNQSTKVYKSNKVGSQMLESETYQNREYMEGCSVDYLLRNNGDYSYAGGVFTANDDKMPYFAWVEFVPILWYDVYWQEEFYDYRIPFLKHPANVENGAFSADFNLKKLPESIYICRITGLTKSKEKKLIKPSKYRFRICSQNFKENSADVNTSDESITAPLILGTDGQAVDEITLAAGSSATFTLNAYSGHTFETPCLDNNVATVSLSGSTLTVTGVSEGTTYFGVYDVQNRQTAVVMVTVEPGSGNHEWVDLGLPSGTLWASCNVGASSPEEYGGYYTFDEAQEFNPPTLDQIEELLENTTSEWTTLNGVDGRKFTGSNGGTIFLPAAGVRYDSGLNSAGIGGFYCSSTLAPGGPGRAYELFFYSRRVSISNSSRDYGRSVRLVR